MQKKLLLQLWSRLFRIKLKNIRKTMNVLLKDYLFGGNIKDYLFGGNIKMRIKSPSI